MAGRLVVSESGGSVRVGVEGIDGEHEVYGSCVVAFDVAFGPKEFDELRWYLEEYLYAPYGAYGEHGIEIEQRLQRWGEELFESLFGEGKPGRPAYLRTRAAEVPPELLIRSDTPQFLGLPWELIKDPAQPTPLALDFAALDRTLATPGPAWSKFSAPSDVLRVLIVIARPDGLDDVRYRMIARPLLDLLDALNGEVVIDVLRPPTLEMLDSRLRAATEARRPYHVVHFDGHGTFASEGPGRNCGYLLFENEHGGEHPVPVNVFAPVLRYARVPLIVLNACRSGMQGDNGTEDAIATRLSDDGASSVVSMAYSVNVDAAAEFMAAFYQALFDGKSVSEAVSAGRRRLHRQPLRPSPKGRLPLQDWIVPVHYARAPVSLPALVRAAQPDLPSLDTLLDAKRRPGQPYAGSSRNAAEAALQAVGKFVGRDEAFFSLERALRTQHVVVVHGFGGTGKTELAKGFARWWQMSGALGNTDWVFFHSFEPGMAAFGLDRVLSEIGSSLYPDFMAKTSGPQQRRDIILQLVRTQRMLLIWDNFESVFSMPDQSRATPPMDEEERALMHSFLLDVAQNAQSGIIITSRSDEPWLGPDRNPIRRLRLVGLARDEAVELADALLEPYPNSRAWREHPDFEALLEWVDGHPLSLRLLLPQLEHKHPSTLLAEIRGMGNLPEGYAGPDRLHSLSVSIKYSLDHLARSMHDRLPALSLFEGVVDCVVLSAFSDDPAVPAPFAGIGPTDWLATLEQLAAIGLLTAIGGGLYHLHPALPAYLAADWRESAGPGYATERAAAETSMLSAYSRFAEWLGVKFRTGDAQLVATIVGWEWRTMGSFLSAALRLSRFRAAQSLISRMHWFFNTRGLVEESRNWLLRCVREVEKIPPADRPLGTDAASLWFYSTSTLGELLIGEDVHAARAVYDKLRKDVERLPKTELRQSYLSSIYHQLGVILSFIGDQTAAARWIRKSLTLAGHDDKTNISATYHQLSVIAVRNGDNKAGETWCRKAIAVSEEVNDQASLAKNNYQLGVIYQLQDRFEDAQHQYRLCYDIEMLVGDRRGACETIYQMGRLARRANHPDIAELRYRDSLKLAEALQYKELMALNYHELGQLSEEHNRPAAEVWFRKSLALFESLHDEQRAEMLRDAIVRVAET